MLVTKLCCVAYPATTWIHKGTSLGSQMIEIKEGGNFRLKTCCLLSDFDTFKITVSKNKY